MRYGVYFLLATLLISIVLVAFIDVDEAVQHVLIDGKHNKKAATVVANKIDINED